MEKGKNEEGKLEHIIKTRPPFNKTSKNPNKNYGVGSMLIWFIVKGAKGAIQFQLNTGGYLKEVACKWANEGKLTYSFNNEPMLGIIQGWDLGYHSPIPMYEGQSKMKDCDIIKGGCYYDGTSLGADKPLQIYIEKDEEGLWKFLEEIYEERFGERR